MFYGEFTHTIDDKGRLIIPAKYRDKLGEAMVTRGLDHHLVLYPLPAWEQLVEKLRLLPMTDPNARDLRRLIFSGAQEVVPDKQGRILVPPYLREYAGITQGAVIAGLESHIEIWNPEAWGKTLESVQNTDAHATNWQALGI
jgi:MraZ protein